MKNNFMKYHFTEDTTVETEADTRSCKKSPQAITWIPSKHLEESFYCNAKFSIQKFSYWALNIHLHSITFASLIIRTTSPNFAFSLNTILISELSYLPSKIPANLWIVVAIKVGYTAHATLLAQDKCTFIPRFFRLM